MYQLTDPIIGKTVESLANVFGSASCGSDSLAIRGCFPPSFSTPRPFASAECRSVQIVNGICLEGLCFTDADGCIIGADLYRPATVSGQIPAVLLPVGHYDDGKRMPEYRIMAETLARMGCMALILDPPGQGDRSILIDPAEAARQKDLWCVAQHMYWGDLCYLNGANFAWIFMQELLSAVHYLATRPDVDPTRIGAVGQSGGGTAVQYLAALSDELTLAVPIHCTTDFQNMLTRHGVGDCEQSFSGFVAKGLDFADFYLPFADRPLLFIAGEQDFFPYDGVVNTVKKLQAYGVGAELYTAKGGHVISDEVRGAAYRFIAAHFGVPTAAEPDALCPDDCLLSLTAAEREQSRRALYEKTIALTAPAETSPFAAAYADNVTVSGDTFTASGSAATVETTARLHRGTSDTLHVVFGVTDAEADALCTGTDSVLAVTFAGEAAYRDSIGRGYDQDAIYFYVTLLAGKAIGAQRAMQGIALLETAVEAVKPTQIHIRGIGSGALTALLARRSVADVASVRLSGGIVDVIHGYMGEEVPYRRSDLVPDLFSVLSCKELTRNFVCKTIEGRNEWWSL